MVFVFIVSHFVEYYTIHPLLFEYHKKWLQSNVIVTSTIPKHILPKSFYHDTCSMYSFYILSILHSHWKYLTSTKKNQVLHLFPKPFLYSLRFKICFRMIAMVKLGFASILPVVSQSRKYNALVVGVELSRISSEVDLIFRISSFDGIANLLPHCTLSINRSYVELSIILSSLLRC